MKVLETIISNKEIKRRTNIRVKKYNKDKRTNEKGLTKRQQEKENKEKQIQELLLKGLNKTQIARKIGISRQKLYSVYEYLL